MAHSDKKGKGKTEANRKEKISSECDNCGKKFTVATNI